MAGAFDDFDPTGAKQQPNAAPQPKQTEGPAASGGAFSDFNPTGASSKQAGGDQTTGGGNGAAQPSGFGVDWSDWRHGWPITMPQPVEDFANIASNEASMSTLPGLKAQAEAARKRLSPETAASADVAGNILSPTTLLNAVPFVGPELAGATHQGIKSYAQGNDWKTIGEDTAGGGIAGLFGQGVAKAAPAILPKLTDEGLKAGLTYGAHKLFGGWAGGDVFKEGAGLLGLYAGLDKVGEKAGELVKNIASASPTRQAIQNLILGGASATRQAAGPWDQWMPGP
jgi:hypothetical protein